jgi:hypothetical protein
VGLGVVIELCVDRSSPVPRLQEYAKRVPRSFHRALRFRRLRFGLDFGVSILGARIVDVSLALPFPPARLG